MLVNCFCFNFIGILIAIYKVFDISIFFHLLQDMKVLHVEFTGVFPEMFK